MSAAPPLSPRNSKSSYRQRGQIGLANIDTITIGRAPPRIRSRPKQPTPSERNRQQPCQRRSTRWSDLHHRTEVDEGARRVILDARKRGTRRITMGSTINLKSADGFTLTAYTAGPAGGTKGLVVIQEIFGVNHHMRDMCDRFAAQGYAVCAPALFDRVEKGVELGYTQNDIDNGRAY